MEKRPGKPPPSLGRMTIALLQYRHITVNDPDESLGFYRDALGLEVRNDVASGGFRWVTLGSPDQPRLELVLSEPRDCAFRDPSGNLVRISQAPAAQP
jgi:catechol 2,3-dioxygenase-like lactoylglutathione lyase family enzyme